MKKNNFLRFGMILSNGQAQTFNKNLTKIIELVLFDSYGQSLTVVEIIKNAKENYALQFCDAEVNKVIMNSDCIIKTKNGIDPVYYTYTITPTEFEKLQKRDKEFSLDNVVARFLMSEGNECPFSVEELRQTIYRYVYETFNTDTSTVLSLMNYQGDKLIEDSQPESFSDDEIIWINAFLNWNDIEKNKLIFNLISSCYEFCMMTVKKDNSSYSTVFNGKQFFLDANIIFRLCGFNNSERKAVVKQFLDKCQSCGIEIKYTNITNLEINNTLEYQVNVIKRFLNGKRPVCTEAMQALSSKYANLDFYDQYVNWIKQPNNKVGDYEAFLRYLKREVRSNLTNMQFVTFDSFEGKTDNKEFKDLCEDFSSYKNQNNKVVYESSIKTDIENYLYMLELGKRECINSFLEKKCFFITADHIYIDWTKGKIPGAIPTFVLPSVWYSLLLKYTGRTDNDYQAFCQFLNKRISEPVDDMLEKKRNMLLMVLSLDERAVIKEEIIFDIDYRLSKENGDVEDVEAYVEASHNNITDKKVDEAISEFEKSHKAEKKEIEKENAARIIEEHDKGKEKGYSVGVEEGVNRIAYNQALKQATRNNTIKKIAIVFAIIGVLSFIGILIITYYKNIETTVKFINTIKDNSTLFKIISLLISVISFLIAKLNKLIDFMSCDVDKLKEKIVKKYN